MFYKHISSCLLYIVVVSFQEHFDVQYLNREQEVKQSTTNKFMEKCFSEVLSSSGKILGLNEQYNIYSTKAMLK